MRNWLPLLWVILALPVEAGQGRYLTWLDDQGRVHNTFIQAEGAAGGFWRSGPTPEANSRMVPAGPTTLRAAMRPSAATSPG